MRRPTRADSSKPAFTIPHSASPSPPLADARALRFRKFPRDRTAPAPPPRAPWRKPLASTLALGLVAAGLLFAPARPTSAQVFSAGVRISQIYTRGGEPGASFRDDFIELFNAGPSPVDLNGWELHVATLEGNVTRVVSAPIFSGAGGTLAPGRHLLLRLAGDGAGGEPLPAPDANFDGYDFWLAKLNQHNGNFVRAEMVRAFIESIEYRQRFGQ